MVTNHREDWYLRSDTFLHEVRCGVYDDENLLYIQQAGIPHMVGNVTANISLDKNLQPSTHYTKLVQLLLKTESMPEGRQFAMTGQCYNAMVEFMTKMNSIIHA